MIRTLGLISSVAFPQTYIVIPVTALGEGTAISTSVYLGNKGKDDSEIEIIYSGNRGHLW